MGRRHRGRGHRGRRPRAGAPAARRRAATAPDPTGSLNGVRYFEYASFTGPTDSSVTQLDRYFPGPFIDRLNPWFKLGSKGQEIGLASKLDFSGTGYRQYFYSTRDQQYAIDEQVRLTTDWTDKIQTNLNYVNNVTPDSKQASGQGTFTNHSPFLQDSISNSTS